MTRYPKKMIVSNIENISHELVSEIIARVAEFSVTDMFNAKLSCKTLNEVAEDMYVYQCVSLNKFPVIPWKPLSEKQETFLEKCRKYGNPELMYREAVVDYFNRANLVSTWQNLQKALKLGHLGALYVTCIVFLFSDDEEQKQKGIKLLGNMKKSKSMRRKLRLCRNNLLSILKEMWVNNPALKERPVCCNGRQHWRRQWRDDEEDVYDDEDVKCEGCCADREISFIRGTYTGS